MVEVHDNVIDLSTRAKLPASYATKPNPYVNNIIEMLHQRQNQIQDIVVMFIEKDLEQQPKIATNPMLDSQLAWFSIILTQWAMREPSDVIEDDVDTDDREV